MAERQNPEKTVLVVHGSNVVANHLVSILKSAPLAVSRSSSSEEARYQFNLVNPDVVIAGLTAESMPLLESFLAASPAIQVIGLTDSDHIAQKARSKGFENVMLTDGSRENLAEGLESFLGEWVTARVPSEDISVLVVEDEPEALDELSDSLRGRGYQVFEARSGQEAIEIVGRNPEVSLIVLELAMREMGGIETLRKLRNQTRKVGAILMSGFADREVVSQAFKLGAFDVVLKPLDIDQLDSSIRACMASLEYRSRPWWKRLAFGN
jgi:CheY-like chemotaxis protein